MFLRRFIPMLPIILGLLAAAPAAADQETDARAVIDDFHGQLLEVMKEAEALGIEGRFERLWDPVERSFDLELMIRVASGSSWRRASADQRVALIAAFTGLSVGTYAFNFDGYSGQAFTTDGVRTGPRGTLLVDTRIHRPGDSPVVLTYVMTAREDGWRIGDVLLDGSISELAVRRSEYSGVLKSYGIDGLIAILEKKADQLVSE